MFSLSSLVILIVIFAIVFVVLSFVNKTKGGSGDEKLYKQKALLTANEIEFFNTFLFVFTN